jgi:hypothetical protein
LKKWTAEENKFLYQKLQFALLDLDPDSEYGSGSSDLIVSGSASETLYFLKGSCTGTLKFRTSRKYNLNFYVPEAQFMVV